MAKITTASRVLMGLFHPGRGSKKFPNPLNSFT